MRKIIILCFFLTSCGSIKNEVKYSNNLRKVELSNEIQNAVRLYKKELTPKSVIYLSFKDKLDSNNKTYYINRVSNLSIIYNYYISYYSFIDSIPVLISSRKDGFIDPKNYTKKFIATLTKKDYLIDDMLYKSIIKLNDEDDSYMYEPSFPLISDHSRIWRVKNNEIEKNVQIKMIKKKLMVENWDSYSDDFNRVVNGGVDERNNKKE